MTEKRTIESEEGAYKLLAQIVNSEIETKDYSFEFKDWPKLTISLSGDEFDETVLTPPIMKGLLDLQKSIYHSYASIRYDDPAKRLTNEEKEALQIIVHVDKGSTLLEVNLQEIAKELVSKLADKMDTKSVIATVVILASAYGGTTSYKHYLDTQRDIRLAEIQAEASNKKEDKMIAAQSAALETIESLSQEETRRMELIAQVTSSLPPVEQAVKEANKAKTRLVKSFAEAPITKVQGIQVTRDASIELTKVKREEAIERRLDATYSILQVNSSDPNEYRVRVRNASTKEEFTTIVQSENLTNQLKNLLQKAEWDHLLINLQINGRYSGKKLTKAVILGAEKFEDAVKKHKA